MERIELRTKQRSEFLNITAQVQAAVNRLERENGTTTVFVPHTTAGITINESADPDVIADIIATLDRLIPWHGTYRHGEGNAAAHVKSSLVGSSVTVAVVGGRLRLGTWQGIFFCEFDGPRNREVWIL